MAAERTPAFRAHVVSLLTWQDAHASFETAVQDLPSRLRGAVPTGAPYSPWQLLEHMRIAQADILDFCQNASSEARAWPDDYWPHSPAPADDQAWNDSVAAFVRDRAALAALAQDSSLDLFLEIPHGTGQTYLRELLLVADHNAYHVGQIVLVRRLLGSWPS